MHMRFHHLKNCGLQLELGGKLAKISGLNIVIFTKKETLCLNEHTNPKSVSELVNTAL